MENEEKKNTGNPEEKTEEVSPSFLLGKKLVEQKEKQQQQKAAEEYSLAERLMRAAAANKVTVKVTDDLGSFTVECRRFTWSEQDRLLDLNRKLQNTQNTKEVLSQEEINKQFFGLLAYPNGVCLNKELDMAFWLKGEYSIDLPRLILLTCQQQSLDSVHAARSFRQPKTRVNPA